MRLDKVISLTFHPSVSTFLGYAIIYYMYRNLLDLFTSLIFFSLLPFLLTVFLRKIGKVSDLLVTRRNERKGVILLSLLGYMIGAFIMYKIGINLFFYVSILYIINSLIILLITLFYKISIHVSVLTSIATFLTEVFGLKFSFLYLLAFLVAWARVKAKEHTVDQVVSALLLFTLFTFFEVKLFLSF